SRADREVSFVSAGATGEGAVENDGFQRVGIAGAPQEVKRAAICFGCIGAFGAALFLCAGQFPRSVNAYPGKTPTLDGVISPGEWDDATTFTNAGWIPQFSPT